MPSSKELNISLAVLGIAMTKARFPLGALNRRQNVLSMGPRMFQTQRNLYEECTRYHPREVLRLQCFTKLEAAQCGIMSLYCKEQIDSVIKLVSPDVISELVSINDHIMVVIGRENGTDENNVNTWGNNAVICDPWSGKFYEATKLPLVQEYGEKIFTISGITSDHDAITVTEGTNNYLDGTAKILKL